MSVCPGCSSPVPEGSKYCPACGLSLSMGAPDPRASHTADASDPHPSDSGKRARFLPGKVLAGRYRVIEMVGKGGMGEVYRAQDLKLGQTVALKFLPPGLDKDPEKRERFYAEVRLAREISHPNVCRVYDVGEMDGVPFLTMEFVDGEDLASLLPRIGRMPTDRANDIAREICAGLAAIHERGVLHRDLKPANVMLDGRGHARITDFGLAELKGTVGDGEMIVGTPAYMSPEVLEGRPADVHSDLYSLGLVLYELYTGKRAFEAASLDELIRIRRMRTPPSPSSLVREIDPMVERLILRCLEKDPKRRPFSAIAAAAALPGGDPLAAALAAGETPSPELVAAARDELQGLRPAIAWSSLAAFFVGLVALVGLSPFARVVPPAPLREPPGVMAVRARDMLTSLGSGERMVDRAQGYHYEEPYVDWISTMLNGKARWRRLSEPRPPVVTYWYRESPFELIPGNRDGQVEYDDPPRLVPGMAGVQLDGLGRLRRLDVLPLANTPRDTAATDWSVLFRMAGLDTLGLRSVQPARPPVGIADRYAAWEGIPRNGLEVPVHIEAASYRGRPVFFAIREPWSEVEGPADSVAVRDPSGRFTRAMIAIVRPLFFVLALVVGAWLARRNLRAGRGDRRRATRVAAILMGVRILIWVIGAHHTPQSVTAQLAGTVAAGLYDFAFGWVFYIAVEPYFRRLWPRVLTSWVRLLDGSFDDPQVGRDLLLGCVVGVAIGLAVILHHGAPTMFGAPAGRPDNVGFVEHQLAALLGFLHQLADALTVQRSALILAMEFVVILVLARLVVRKAIPSILVTFLLFIPFALPKGEWLWLNIAFAACSLGLVFFVMLRFGLLPAIVALLVNSTLQSTPLEWDPSSWYHSANLVTLSAVVAVALYGFIRSLAGQSPIRDVFPDR